MITLSPHIRPVLLTASLLGLLATLVITFPQTVSATILVKDDFEVTNLSSEWDGLQIHDDANPAGSAKVTNAQSYTGSSSIQFNWIASNTGTIYLSKILPNVSHLFLRYAVKWSPGFQFFPGTTAGKKVGRTWGFGSNDDILFDITKVGGGDQTPEFTVYVNQFNRNNIHPSLLKENIGARTPVNYDQWYCFDWHIVTGMGTGSIEGWIDGVKKWEFFNTYTSSIPIIKFDLGGNLSPDRPTQNQTEWYDNVAVADAPISSAEVAGCAIHPKAPLAPLAPIGLKVH